MAKFGRAAITWTSTEDGNTQRVFLLDTPLHDTIPAHSITSYYAESLDRTKNTTVTVGNGAYGLSGTVRFASNPAGLMDMVKAGSQGKALVYIHDLADPAVQEPVILMSPRSPAALEQDAQRGFRSEAQVTLEFRRTDQKAMRARGGDVLFEYHAGDSITGATYTRTTGGTYPGVASTADFGYGTVTTAAANKLRVGWYSSKSSAGPRTIPATLLEPARKNLIKWSQTFASSNWTPSSPGQISHTSVQADPLGGTAAWRVRSSAGIAGGYIQSTTFTASTFITVSAFCKQDIASTSAGRLRVMTSGVSVVNVAWRFSSGVMLSSVDGITKGARVAVERYRNGWYRISGRSSAVGSGAHTMILNVPTPGGAGTTQGAYFFGAQVECT